MKRTALLVLLLLFIGVQVGFAQDLPELSESYTSDDGLLIVQHPADWVVLHEDEVIVLAHKSTIDEVENDDPIPNGYFVVTFLLPSQLGQAGLEATADPEDVINRVIELTNVTGEVTPYTRLGVQGTSAMVTGVDVAHGQLVALQFETGTLLAAIEFSADVEDYMEQAQNRVAHGLGGLIYNGQSAADGSVDTGLNQNETPTSATLSEPAFAWITARPFGTDLDANFATVRDVRVGTDGSIYVLDPVLGIWQLDPVTGEVVKHIPLPSLIYNAEDFAIDPATGNFYVASWLDSTIFILSSEGDLLDTFGEEGTGSGQFGRYSPEDVALHNGELYAIDTNRDDESTRIEVFDLDGNFLRDFDITDTATFMPSLAIDENGAVYVAGGYEGIGKYDSNGNLIKAGIGSDILAYNRSNAIDVADDRVYLVSYNGVTVLDTDGSLVGTYGIEVPSMVDEDFMPAPGDVSRGTGIAAGSGAIYITDIFPNNVSSISALSWNVGSTDAQTTTPDDSGMVMGVLTDELPEQPWKFSADAGDIVTITMTATSGTLEPYLYLYAADNYPGSNLSLANNGALIGERDVSLEDITLAESGEYIIVAARFIGEGDYDLTLSGTGSYSLEYAGAGSVVAQPTTEGEEIRQWARAATGSSQYGQQSWSFLQATGEPNTDTCGDRGTAWASSSSRGVDNLTLTFDQAVIPAQVNIYQTYNPGSIIRVELFNVETGETVELPDSADSPGNTPCPGVFSLDFFGIDTPINGVVIYLDQTIGGGWNEIDAVELVGYEGTAPTPSPVVENVAQWANFATGTSQYGEVGWSFMQATGAPDAADCGDSLQAWASSEVTSSEILALEFEQAVIPSQVNIYQNYNPGAITRIELTNTDTSTIIAVPDSADPPGNTDCPGVFTVDISDIDTPVNGVILYLDQTLVGDWNEIDAVELVGVRESSPASGAVTAQPTASSSDMTYLSDDYQGEFTVEYPDTWVLDFEGDIPALASSPDVLNISLSANPGSEIAVQIVLPDMLAQFGASGLAAREVAAMLAAQYRSTAPIEIYDEVSVPAAVTHLNGTNAPTGSHIVAFDTAQGAVAFAVRTNQFDTFAPVINHMVESFAFTSAEDAPTVEANEAATAEAGDFDVSEAFVFDGANHIFMYYPVGWIMDVSALPLIASSDEAAAALQRGAAMPAGEIAIGIIPPKDLPTVLGVEAGATAEATLETLGGVFGGELAIESVEGLTYPAAITPLVGTTRLPADTRLLAFEHGNGVVTFVILTDDLDAYLPLLAEMIATLSMS